VSHGNGLFFLNSPWQVPLLQPEQKNNRVVVYYYNGGWIPITFYPLVEAIRLHRLALSSGMDIVLFPPNLDPRYPNFPLSPTNPDYEANNQPIGVF
jgi:hypothetical protein